MKKFVSGFLTFILIDLMAILMINATFKEVLVKGVLVESMKSIITRNMYKEPNINLNDIIKGDNVITENPFVNEIIQSDEVQVLVNDFMETVIEELIEEDGNFDKIDELELEKRMVDYLKENKEVLEKKTGIPISDTMIEFTAHAIQDKDLTRAIKQNINNIQNNMTAEEKLLLKTYKIITSSQLKTMMILGIILTILLIALVQWSFYKWIKNTSLSLIISGILVSIMSIILKIVLVSITKNEGINTWPMLRLSLIVMGIGIVIFTAYKMIELFLKREKKHEVS